MFRRIDPLPVLFNPVLFNDVEVPTTMCVMNARASILRLLAQHASLTMDGIASEAQAKRALLGHHAPIEARFAGLVAMPPRLTFAPAPTRMLAECHAARKRNLASDDAFR